MKSKLVILTLVGLSAGAFGAVGSRILARSEDPPTAVAETRSGTRRGVEIKPARDTCRAVARKVSTVSMTDAELERVLTKAGNCRAVVVDAKASGTMPVSGPRVVTIGANPPPVPAPAVSPYESEDESDESDHEEEQEDHDEEQEDHDGESANEHEEDD